MLIRTIQTTLATQDEAVTLVRSLVEDRLVACGQISAPITSIYRWQGQVEQGQEVSVSLKVSAERCAAAIAAIKERHPYSVPQIIAHDAACVDPGYAQWVQEETKP
jgi:periplasmic divalent cation tolerance protein